MNLARIVNGIVGFDYQVFNTMGVNIFKGVFRLSGSKLTIEQLAKRLSKYNPRLVGEAAITRAKENLEEVFYVPGGKYCFAEVDGKYKLQYEGKSLLNTIDDFSRI